MPGRSSAAALGWPATQSGCSSPTASHAFRAASNRALRSLALSRKAGTKPATTPARAPGITPVRAPTAPCTASPITAPPTVSPTTTRTTASARILHPTLVHIHAGLYWPPPIRPDRYPNAPPVCLCGVRGIATGRGRCGCAIRRQRHRLPAATHIQEPAVAFLGVDAATHDEMVKSPLNHSASQAPSPNRLHAMHQCRLDYSSRWSHTTHRQL
jgi:hypothetical protein